MQQIKLIRMLYKLRKLMAVFVLVEWLYKAHKSRPAVWLAEKRKQKRTEV